MNIYIIEHLKTIVNSIVVNQQILYIEGTLLKSFLLGVVKSYEKLPICMYKKSTSYEVLFRLIQYFIKFWKQ